MNNNDWFDNALEELYVQASRDTNLGYDEVVRVYSYLSDLGFIDYDTEKEILWDLFVESDEED